MSERSDFQSVVVPFFDHIRMYDPKDGKLSNYIMNGFRNCLALKGEHVDYSFVPSALDPKNIKLRENLLIACHAFKVAVGEVEDCSDHDMVEIYDNFRIVGREQGWNMLDFDKTCLDLMGVEVRQVAEPTHLPSVQVDADYN